jgi:molecular chaperone GrpE
LAKHGVHEIPAEGADFDPNLHEAISQIPSEDVESGKVAHVAVSGFKLHERVIRPSQVVVSTGPPA